MNSKDTKSSGNPILTMALIGPFGSLFGAPRPRISRIESKPEPAPTPRRPR
jgi:hypothetical protein